MQAHDIISRDPSPEEIAAAVRRLRPAPVEEAALRKELADAPVDEKQARWPEFLEAPRQLTDTRHADAPSSHRPYLGPLLVAAKRVFRATCQPFINEVLRRQVHYNEAILEAAVQLHHDLRQHLENEALWRARMDERLTALERERSQPEGAEPVRFQL